MTNAVHRDVSLDMTIAAQRRHGALAAESHRRWLFTADDLSNRSLADDIMYSRSYVRFPGAIPPELASLATHYGYYVSCNDRLWSPECLPSEGFLNFLNYVRKMAFSIETRAEHGHCTKIGGDEG